MATEPVPISTDFFFFSRILHIISGLQPTRRPNKDEITVCYHVLSSTHVTRTNAVANTSVRVFIDQLLTNFVARQYVDHRHKSTALQY